MPTKTKKSKSPDARAVPTPSASAEYSEHKAADGSKTITVTQESGSASQMYIAAPVKGYAVVEGGAFGYVVIQKDPMTDEAARAYGEQAMHRALSKSGGAVPDLRLVKFEEVVNSADFAETIAADHDEFRPNFADTRGPDRNDRQYTEPKIGEMAAPIPVYPVPPNRP